MATVRGIPVELHPSLVAVAVASSAWVATFQRDHLGRWAAVGALLLLTVVLHELGHAAAAARFGVRTQRVVLYPFGGVAELRGLPRSLVGEAIVSFAGPAVNFALAFGLWALADAVEPTLLRAAAAANLLIGAFNLLPIYPMDGGRILLAALTAVIGRVSATRWSLVVATGTTLAAFIGGAVARDSNVVVVAGFLLWTVRQESRRVEIMVSSGMISNRRR